MHFRSPQQTRLSVLNSSYVLTENSIETRDADDVLLRRLAYDSYETDTHILRLTAAQGRNDPRESVEPDVYAFGSSSAPLVLSFAHKRLVATRQTTTTTTTTITIRHGEYRVFWRLLYEPHLHVKEIVSTRIGRRRPCNFDRFSSRSSG